MAGRKWLFLSEIAGKKFCIKKKKQNEQKIAILEDRSYLGCPRILRTNFSFLHFDLIIYYYYAKIDIIVIAAANYRLNNDLEIRNKYVGPNSG